MYPHGIAKKSLNFILLFLKSFLKKVPSLLMYLNILNINIEVHCKLF